MTPQAFAIILLLVLIPPLAASANDSVGKKKCALVIGLDGVRPDALRAANTPVLDSLIKDGAVAWDAFAGGKLGTATQQKTSSGPGWSSILTGVWVNQHRVKDNGFRFTLLSKYPHFFARIKSVKPDAVFGSAVSWAPIEDKMIAPIAENFAFHVKGEGKDYIEKDASVVAKANEFLKTSQPDALMLHLDQVDGAGHSSGFTPKNPAYLAAIEQVDGLIGKVLQTIRGRETYDGEDWLVVITTDHGGIQKNHGGQTSEERTIFLIASGGGIAPAVISGSEIGHTAVPATVAKHLGIEPDPAWGWDKTAFGFEQPSKTEPR